jgi:urease accessory protein
MNFAHLQLLDSALPIGAFSHSFGLETLVQEGRIASADDVRAFCQTTLHAVWAPCDAMAIKAVYQWATPEHFEQLWAFDHLLHVARAPGETREGTRKIGKRLLSLCRALHPQLDWEPPERAVFEGKCVGALPTIHGWACHQLGVSLDEATTGFLFGCLNASVNNAVRAMRLGQTDGQKIIAALAPEIEKAWIEVESRNVEDFAAKAPVLEIAQMRHERLYSRLFMS